MLSSPKSNTLLTSYATIVIKSKEREIKVWRIKGKIHSLNLKIYITNLTKPYKYIVGENRVRKIKPYNSSFFWGGWGGSSLVAVALTVSPSFCFSTTLAWEMTSLIVRASSDGVSLVGGGTSLPAPTPAEVPTSTRGS